MSDMTELRQRLERLKVDPPSAGDDITLFGRKMIELADLNMRLLDLLVAKQRA